MTYKHQEWPKMFYRLGDDGEREDRVFDRAEDVEPGWVDFGDLGSAVEKPAKKAAKKTAPTEQEPTE